jgi:hypothetical protein
MEGFVVSPMKLKIRHFGVWDYQEKDGTWVNYSFLLNGVMIHTHWPTVSSMRNFVAAIR